MSGDHSDQKALIRSHSFSGSSESDLEAAQRGGNKKSNLERRRSGRRGSLLGKFC